MYPSQEKCGNTRSSRSIDWKSEELGTREKQALVYSEVAVSFPVKGFERGCGRIKGIREIEPI